MSNRESADKVTDFIKQKFTIPVPLFLSTDKETLKFEPKPYLQPFEQKLALMELHTLLGNKVEILEDSGLFIASKTSSEEYFRHHLTYWQRVGRSYLEPTIQNSLEFTQIGLAKLFGRSELHNARRLRYGPHDLHEYRGKFFPQLVRSLINISGVSEKAIVLDPMCGSGTTICEAIAAGRSAFGADLNPLSVLISRVKSSLPLEEPNKFADTIDHYIESFTFPDVQPFTIWQEDDLRYLKLWFDFQSLRDISSVLAEIATVCEPLYQDFFKICLSNIIRAVSWQKETDLRVRKEVVPYEQGLAIHLFKAEVENQIDKIYPYLCVIPKYSQRPFFDIRNGDAVSIASVFQDFVAKAELLITSPPYATALPYLDTDRLSLIILGLLPRKKHKEVEAKMVGTREVSERGRREAWEDYLVRRSELPASVTSLIDDIAEHNHGDGVGFRRRNLPALLGKYFLNMLASMRSAKSLMQTGSFAYYVVGNNSTTVSGDKIEIPTDKLLYELAASVGWQCCETIPMELLMSRDIFKENQGSSETILCLRA